MPAVGWPTQRSIDPARLDAFAISRTREWIRTQLTRMDELEVIRVTQIGTVMVAQLRQAGRHHVERRAFVDGIAHPSEVD
ncbi:hypothetical protein JT366_09340 [Sphingomonas paucimobilis]|uniref:hypothetical protein n=1 Tax=Sphingomonas paucimobilis TaxID=13689 RepID=UPI0019638BB8|nr:hypothetical protein [Sphingomonas paucimobilis]QRY97397.1 hypothetical protein JT366_09340 [Sphingomonas paucimobilis]